MHTKNIYILEVLRRKSSVRDWHSCHVFPAEAVYISPQGPLESPGSSAPRQPDTVMMHTTPCLWRCGNEWLTDERCPQQPNSVTGIWYLGNDWAVKVTLTALAPRDAPVPSPKFDSCTFPTCFQPPSNLCRLITIIDNCNLFSLREIKQTVLPSAKSLQRHKATQFQQQHGEGGLFVTNTQRKVCMLMDLSSIQYQQPVRATT